MHIFIYGSLIIPSSLESAVQRHVSAEELSVVYVKGYRRFWSAKVPVFSKERNEEVDGIFLDLVEAPGCFVNGLLLSVSNDDLKSLEKREAQYKKIDLTENVLDPCCMGRRPIITFVFQGDSCSVDSCRSAFIPERYWHRVLDACLNIGENFRREFTETTEESCSPRFPGEYLFMDPEQQKRV
jgi:hypothetical protein